MHDVHVISSWSHHDPGKGSREELITRYCLTTKALNPLEVHPIHKKLLQLLSCNTVTNLNLLHWGGSRTCRRRGRQSLRWGANSIYFIHFLKNQMKLKKLWSVGGVRAGSAPLYPPPDHHSKHSDKIFHSQEYHGFYPYAHVTLTLI